MNSYSKQLIVSKDDLDDLEHVNNIRYLEWVQEIAAEHWQRLTCPAWEQNYFWVVKSHHMEYSRSALAGDLLKITTHVKQVRGALSHRVVEFYSGDNPRPLASCLTQWCLIDRKNGKPSRIPGDMLGRLTG